MEKLVNTLAKMQQINLGDAQPLTVTFCQMRDRGDFLICQKVENRNCGYIDPTPRNFW